MEKEQLEPVGTECDDRNQEEWATELIHISDRLKYDKENHPSTTQTVWVDRLTHLQSSIFDPSLQP